MLNRVSSEDNEALRIIQIVQELTKGSLCKHHNYVMASGKTRLMDEQTVIYSNQHFPNNYVHRLFLNCTESEQSVFKLADALHVCDGVRSISRFFFEMPSYNIIRLHTVFSAKDSVIN